MTTSKKAALSLLFSVLLFGGFAALAFTGLFDLLETRFYNPSIVASITRDNERNAEVIDRFFSETQNRFSETLKTQAVRRSFMSNQHTDDISDRAKIFSNLIESSEGIQWVRFIDSGGENIFFSSYGPDILHHDGQSAVYHNYNEIDLPYREIAVNEGETPKYTFDERRMRILFSFPLYDLHDIYWGTALFSLSTDAVLSRLIAEGRIRFGQDFGLISNPPGLLFGMTTAGERTVASQISSTWREEGQRTTSLIYPASGPSFALISSRTSQGIFVGRLVSGETLAFPEIMKIILLALFFVTVFLLIFLLFNLRQDPVTVVQNRLKQLQVSFMERLCEFKDEADLTRWIWDLEQRKDEIIALMKKDIKTSSDKENADIDVLIGKFWEELLSVLGRRKGTGVDEEKLQSILKQILADLAAVPIQQTPAFPVEQQAQISISASTGKPSFLMRAAAIVKELEEAETVEGPEELEELEGLEEPGELEELEGPEDSGELEELEVVSPFSAMHFDFPNPGDKKPAGEEGGQEENGIIEERDGVPYINEDALTPDLRTAADLNKNFKNLVDSILGPKP